MFATYNIYKERIFHNQRACLPAGRLRGIKSGGKAKFCFVYSQIKAPKKPMNYCLKPQKIIYLHSLKKWNRRLKYFQESPLKDWPQK